jgi:precorrin-6B methylase 2
MSISNLSGAPYVISTSQKISVIKKLIPPNKNLKVIDLGSGDGSIVIEVAKLGYKTFGIEVNPFLVLLSRFNIKRAQLKNNPQIIWKSFWDIDLSSYDVLIIFGLPWVMKRLEKKLSKELKKGTLVISNDFKFPNFEIFKEENGVFVYKF